MIEITNKKKCCGCTACYNACPTKCISMVEDFEGFLYPKIDLKKCINCKICEKVCPYNKSQGNELNNSLYGAIQHNSKDVRKTSTAGGAFTLIADYFIKKSGVVFAVGYDSNMVVVHKKCNSIQDIVECRGSKYVQSSLNDTYNEIKKIIKNDIYVLFVGTPCQIHGLKSFLGDNEKLYTIDLLCLGVSSPKLFSNWIKYLNSKYDSNIIDVQFRNKKYGYSTPNVRVFFENGKEFDQKYDSKVHANLFFKHLNVRPSCYECEFREKPRLSDFTIGDFNEIYKFDKNMDDDIGTTKIWIHTKKGKKLFNELNDLKFLMLNDNSSNILGGPKKQINIPVNRKDFFDDVQILDYEKLVNKWIPNTLKSKLIGVIRKIINIFPFKTVLFKYLRKKKSDNFEKNVRILNEENN